MSDDPVNNAWHAAHNCLPIPKGPQAITVERAHAYFEWAMQMGLGKDTVALDRRGLEFLLEKHLPTQGLAIPPEGDQHGGGRVYLRLAF